MHSVVDAVNRLALDLQPLVLAVAWQAMLLAVTVALVALGLHRVSPAARYWLWQLVPLKLLVLPFWSVSLPAVWIDAEATPVVAAPAVEQTVPAELSAAYPAAEISQPEPGPRPEVSPPAKLPTIVQPAALTWRGGLLLGWAAIVALQLWRLLLQRVRLSKLLRGASPAEPALIGHVSQVASDIGLAKPPAVIVTECEGSPFVCGIYAPRLVLSQTLLAGLSGVELRLVLAHELAHLKRHDLIWGWIPALARLLWFFHPAAHWAAARIRLERELACDQIAMATSGTSPGEYAQALVRVLSAVAQPRLLSASAASLDGGEVLSAQEEQPT